MICVKITDQWKVHLLFTTIRNCQTDRQTNKFIWISDQHMIQEQIIQGEQCEVWYRDEVQILVGTGVGGEARCAICSIPIRKGYLV